MSLQSIIITALRDIQLTRYSQLGSSVVIIFDHLLTLDEEIDLIWNSSWSLGKVLFLMNRYYSLAAVAFNNYAFFSPRITSSVVVSRFCNLRYMKFVLSVGFGICFIVWQGWTGLIGCMLAEGILQIRIYALYSLNKKILGLMLVCFAASTATSAWIMGTSLASFTATAVKIPDGRFCVPSGVSPRIYAFWAPMLAFETLLCVLAMIRGIQTFKSNGSLFHSGRQLVGILIRDSLMYFIVICMTYLTCLLVWRLAPTSLLEVPVGFSVAMSCVLANRVVLNVREVSRDIETTRHTTQSQKHIIVNGTAFESFCSPGTLTEFEMERLRTMRVARQSTITTVTYDDDVPMPFVVL